VSLALLAVGDQMIAFIFSEDFAASSLPLKILAGATPFMFLNQLLKHLLASIDKQSKEALNNVISLCAFLIMILVLIPRMDYIGAAVAIAISEVALFVLNYYSTSKLMGRVPLGEVLRPALSFCVAVAVLLVIPVVTHWLVLGAVVELVYLVALVISGTFSKREVTAFAGEFRRLSAALLKR
jgi:O-antigen/teichoic acid export membrane protein